jgi:4'-phosphopantetheinyl transferase EntD
MPAAEDQIACDRNATRTEISPSLSAAIERLAIRGAGIRHRVIVDGDEHALLPAEAGKFASSVTKVRRASGAARRAARELLSELGHVDAALPRSATGAPVWPAGIVGSLAHDATVAIAAVARRDAIAALGIDIEPLEPLPFKIDDVATARERRSLPGGWYVGRLLFAAKEAVYKAVHPLDGRFLEHHDVEVDFASGHAVVRGGRTVDLRFVLADHIVTVAFLYAITMPGRR